MTGLAGFLWAALAADGQQSLKQDAGPLRALVAAPAGNIGLSQAFQVRVTLSGPERVVVSNPPWQVGTAFPGAKVIAFHAEGPDLVAGPFGSRAMRSWEFRIEPLALGALNLPPLPIKYREGNAAEQTSELRIPAVTIVAEHTTGADLAQLREPQFAPEQPPAAPPADSLRTWLIAGGAAVE